MPKQTVWVNADGSTYTTSGFVGGDPNAVVTRAATGITIPASSPAAQSFPAAAPTGVNVQPTPKDTKSEERTAQWNAAFERRAAVTPATSAPEEMWSRQPNTLTVSPTATSDALLNRPFINQVVPEAAPEQKTHQLGELLPAPYTLSWAKQSPTQKAFVLGEQSPFRGTPEQLAAVDWTKEYFLNQSRAAETQKPKTIMDAWFNDTFNLAPTLNFTITDRTEPRESGDILITPVKKVQTGTETAFLAESIIQMGNETQKPPEGYTWDIAATRLAFEQAGFSGPSKSGANITMTRPVFGYVPAPEQKFVINAPPISKTIVEYRTELAKDLAAGKSKLQFVAEHPVLSLARLGAETRTPTFSFLTPAVKIPSATFVSPEIPLPIITEEIAKKLWPAVEKRTLITTPSEIPSQRIYPGLVAGSLAQGYLFGATIGAAEVAGFGGGADLATKALLALQGEQIISGTAKGLKEQPGQTIANVFAMGLGGWAGHEQMTKPRVSSRLGATETIEVKGTLINQEGEGIGEFTKSKVPFETETNYPFGLRTEKTSLIGESVKTYPFEGDLVSAQTKWTGTRTISRAFAAKETQPITFLDEMRFARKGDWLVMGVGEREISGRPSEPIFTTLQRVGFEKIKETPPGLDFQEGVLKAAIKFDEAGNIESGKAVLVEPAWVVKLPQSATERWYWSGTAETPTGAQKFFGTVIDSVISPKSERPEAVRPTFSFDFSENFQGPPKETGSPSVFSIFKKESETAATERAAAESQAGFVAETHRIAEEWSATHRGTVPGPSAPKSSPIAEVFVQGLRKSRAMTEEESFQPSAIGYPSQLQIPTVVPPIQFQPSASATSVLSGLSFVGLVLPNQRAAQASRQTGVSAFKVSDLLVSSQVQKVSTDTRTISGATGSKIGDMITGTTKTISGQIPSLKSAQLPIQDLIPRQVQAQPQLQPQLQIEKVVQEKPTPFFPTPVITPLFFPGGGAPSLSAGFGFGDGFGSGKRLRGPKAGYAPSLAGLLSGRTIGKAPSMDLSGAEVRYPVMKLKKGEKKHIGMASSVFKKEIAKTAASSAGKSAFEPRGTKAKGSVNWRGLL